MQFVIMAGGAGTRFWPLSRRHRPKQLLRMFGGRPMITETVARCEGLAPPGAILIVTAENLVDAVREAVPEIPVANILGEPLSRNTAPCVGLAAVLLRQRLGREDEALVVLPADHFVRDTERFRAALRAADRAAADGSVVTIGIEPTTPETGYGYIRRGERAGDQVWTVEAFVEKPDRATAYRYLADGRYLWNAGIFVFRIDAILAEYRRLMPKLYSQLERLAERWPTDAEGVRQIYEEMEAVSIDYGILEKAERVRVVPAEFGWSDVGHWDALPDVSERDAAGNVTMGDVIAIDCVDSVLVGHDQRVLAAVGLNRVVVVDTEDAVLVSPRDRVQEVRRVVEALRDRSGGLV